MDDSKVILTRVGTVRIDVNVRSNIDRRVLVDRHVVAYVDGQGDEFRKSFEVKSGSTPRIPLGGYSDAINEWCKQWEYEAQATKPATKPAKRKAKAAPSFLSSLFGSGSKPQRAADKTYNFPTW